MFRNVSEESTCAIVSRRNAVNLVIFSIGANIVAQFVTSYLYQKVHIHFFSSSVDFTASNTLSLHSFAFHGQCARHRRNGADRLKWASDLDRLLARCAPSAPLVLFVMNTIKS